MSISIVNKTKGKTYYLDPVDNRWLIFVIADVSFHEEFARKSDAVTRRFNNLWVNSDGGDHLGA